MLKRSKLRRIVRNLTVVPLRKLLSFLKSFKEKKIYLEQYANFIKNNSRFRHVGMFPILNEKGLVPFDNHYFYHPAWAFRVICNEIKPERHVDISSVMSFAADLSSVVPVDYYEYNLPAIELDNFRTGRVDIVSLPFSDGSIPSLSCMHVVEHIGLGRYGDTPDIDGDLKAVSELKRVLAKNGHLLFVVPLSDDPRVEFNAHRVYSYEMVLEMFNGLSLIEFAIIPENGHLIRFAGNGLCKGQSYACGCFHFVKN